MPKKKQPPRSRRAVVPTQPSPWTGVGIALTACLGIAYLFAFFATRLPSLEGITGQTFRRIDYFTYLLLPDAFVEFWTGNGPTAIFDRLPVLANAVGILLVGTSTGWLLLRAVGIARSLGRLDTVVFSSAVGLNVLSTYMFAIGLAGGLSRSWLVVLPAVLVLVLTGRVFFKTKNERGEHRGISRPPIQPELSLGWLWLAAPFVAIILLGAMLPPVDFDVREYHLQVPKEWFQQGQVTFLPHNVYGNMTLGSSMHALAGMTVTGDWWLGALAGKTVVASFSVLTALGLIALGRRWFSMTTGIVAAVVYLSIPWVTRVSSAGLVEGVVACYLLLSVHAVLLWQNGGDRGDGFSRRYLLLAGYLAGAAVATKYPAALFVALPLTVAVAVMVPRDRAGLKTVGLFVAAVVVGCGLWFGKNAVFTGNPTYPLLHRVFGGEAWSVEKNARWSTVHGPRGFTPGTITTDIARVACRSEWLSLAVMPLAALGLFLGRGNRYVRLLAGYFAYVLLTWWLFTHRIDRFWIPALPLAALLAGVAVGGTSQSLGDGRGGQGRDPHAPRPSFLGDVLPAWRRRVLLGALLFSCLAAFLVASHPCPGTDVRYFASLAMLREDPRRVDAWHLYFNRHARHGKLLAVGEAEVFDLEMPVLYNTVFDDCLFERIARNRSTEEIHEELVRLGVTHLYVDWSEIARYRSAGNYGFTDFVQPGVFDRLVREEVLRPMPSIEGSRGAGFEVVLAHAAGVGVARPASSARGSRCTRATLPERAVYDRGRRRPSAWLWAAWSTTCRARHVSSRPSTLVTRLVTARWNRVRSCSPTGRSSSSDS